LRPLVEDRGEGALRDGEDLGEVLGRSAANAER